MENAIEIRDLHKRYGQIVAMDGLTFNVASGEIFGLLGPNGAGKTTTVECLLGLRTPDAGEICLLGMMHADQSRAIRARLGVQLQSTGLLPQLTVREQVQFFADLFPRSLPVDDVVARVGLTGMAKTATRALSGGQKQRLAVALALINDPDLLFLDEPTTGLDPQARRALWDLVRDLRQTGKTILLTTHYMEEAEQLCDRVAIMDHGRIIELGTPAALIHKYFHETAIEFTEQSDLPRESLMALPAVTQTRFENGQMTLYSADVPRTMAALFDLASTSALAFHDMSVRQATLEDVFLNLTGRRIRS
ncbi:MAG: ABC transporter ATP-binding protein [Anaerolineales bacterium]|nr:ABC transporter ATP-binding protein [Anaerolineales bacterium]